jgi:hypothetical protein
LLLPPIVHLKGPFEKIGFFVGFELSEEIRKLDEQPLPKISVPQLEKGTSIMRRILLGFLLSSIGFSAFGQIRSDQGDFFIDFGPKVMVGENSLYNSKASFNSDRYFHHPSSIGYGAGFKFAFNFNRNIAIVGEAVYYKFNQVYDMTDPSVGGGGEISYQKTISYSTLEVPIMFRYNNDDMDYWEFGYVHSTIQEFSETNEGKGPSTSEDIAELYEDQLGGAVLGFGGYVYGNGNFGISTGLRLRYDFDGIVAENGSIDLAPVYALDSEPSGSTNPLSLNLVVEFNYDLGFAMANSGCGNRKLIFGGG